MKATQLESLHKPTASKAAIGGRWSEPEPDVAGIDLTDENEIDEIEEEDEDDLPLSVLAKGIPASTSASTSESTYASTESTTAPKKRGRPKKVIMTIEDEPEPVMRRSKRIKN